MTKKGYATVRFLLPTSYGFAVDSAHAPAEKVLVDGEEKIRHASQDFAEGEVAELPDVDVEILVRDGCAVVIDSKGNEVEDGE